ncbi:MAG: class I SAM-dependent methyltransferase [bacterium]|nr:class I SAM-dependent methyltransferase [bacterium]
MEGKIENPAAGKIRRSTIKYQARSSYKGDVAAAYDRKRAKRIKWKREMAAIQKAAAEFETGSSILDIPLGTGRFLQCYTKNHTVYGIDISQDMLIEAENKAPEGEMTLHMILGEAERIPLPDKSVDYVVCIRLLNWVTQPIFEEIIPEFSRVARKGVVIGYRCQEPMTFGDFLRLAPASIVPTPQHIARWWNTTKRFTKKVTGKIKSILPTKNKTTQQAKNKKVFTGSSLYDPKETEAFLQKQGLTLNQSWHIDTLPLFSKRKIRPYSIYSLKCQ